MLLKLASGGNEWREGWATVAEETDRMQEICSDSLFKNKIKTDSILSSFEMYDYFPRFLAIGNDGLKIELVIT